MKVLCTDHVDVNVPAESVFSFVADVSRWPVWFSSIVSAQHPESLPVALDEELHVCLLDGRRRRQETFEITRFVRSAFLSLEGSYSAARRIDFRFEQRGLQTRVACAIGYPVFGGFLSAMLDAAFRRPRVRHELRDSLGRLKGMLEERVESMAIGDDIDDIYEGSQNGPSSVRDATPTSRMKEPAGAI